MERRPARSSAILVNFTNTVLANVIFFLASMFGDASCMSCTGNELRLSRSAMFRKNRGAAVLGYAHCITMGRTFMPSSTRRGPYLVWGDFDATYCGILPASPARTALCKGLVAERPFFMEDSDMRKKNVESPPYMVAIVKAEALSDVAMRLASLPEALDYCYRFENHEQAETRAVILADRLPDPPTVGSCMCEWC
jgi:hypothetical protein